MRYFINYGPKYDRAKFQPIENRKMFNKPKGGYWASPTDSSWGWRDWTHAEQWRPCDGLDYTVFKLKETARVAKIANTADVLKLFPGMTYSGLMTIGEFDFERLVTDGIDAIEFHETPETHWVMYGWDCDSLLVLNPDVIVLVDEDEIREQNINVSVPVEEDDDDVCVI